MESLELRDRRFHAQKALKALGDDAPAEERQALEQEIAHYQEVCEHEHAEEVEGQWRCRDCDLQKTTAVPEPEPEPAAEPEAAPQAAPAAEPAPAPQAAPAAEPAPAPQAAPAAEPEAAPQAATAAEPAPAAPEDPEKPAEG